MTRLLTPEDFYAFKLVEDVRISPDGSRIAYVQAEVDREAYEYRRSIWIQPVEGGEPLQFTTGAHDSSPRWSPDGRMLAFVRAPASDVKPKDVEERARASARRKSGSFHLDGGEARQLTFQRDGASGPVWSPDGTQIAFTAQDRRARRSRGGRRGAARKDDPACAHDRQSLVSRRWAGLHLCTALAHLQRFR